MAAPDNASVPPSTTEEDPTHPPAGGKSPIPNGEKVVTDKAGAPLTDEHGNPLPI